MKAHIRSKQIDIYNEVKNSAYKYKEIDELYFYRNMYNAMEKLSILYEDGYDAAKVYKDIVKDMNVSDSVQEVIELTALEIGILSLLVGLNREALQDANSNTEDRSLFQYLNYQSEAKVPISPYKTISAYEYSKKLAEQFKFNDSKEGPFPYMLCISKSDSRNRPYDCVTKMRNALQHAEYFQRKGEINTFHITNHDDYGDLSFEADLLLWPYRNFVEDFYGLGLGVSNIFELYDIPRKEVVINKDDLADFLRDIVCSEISFKKVPDKYKFSGQNGLFSKLNQCFGIDSSQRKDVMLVLDELKKEGLEFEVLEKKLNEDNINNIIEYLESVYPSEFMYNNKGFIKYASSIVKLMHNPNHDITNSLSNILRYIDMKKQYLVLKEKPDVSLFNEQFYDQHLKLSFKYTLMLLRANLVSYSLECSKFERPDFSSIDLSGINVYPQEEYNLRVVEDYNNTGDVSSNKFVIINGIRNAIAHGNNRLTIKAGSDREIILSDLYDSKHELHIAGGLDTFEKMFSNSCFHPDNIKVKTIDKSKVKSLGTK